MMGSIIDVSKYVGKGMHSVEIAKCVQQAIQYADA